MSAIALYMLMHACSIAPTDRADRWMDELLAAKQRVYERHADDWRTDYQAADAMFQRCINGVLRSSQAKMDSAVRDLQAVADDINAAIARDAKRRRIVRRILRLGIP